MGVQPVSTNDDLVIQQLAQETLDIWELDHLWMINVPLSMAYGYVYLPKGSKGYFSDIPSGHQCPGGKSPIIGHLNGESIDLNSCSCS